LPNLKNEWSPLFVDYFDLFSHDNCPWLMRLSTRGEYGLLAIVDLALHSNQGPVQSFQVAERQHIPKQYLDQLMLILKKAGLVESSRGRQGGYALARPASRISVLEIVAALEGPVGNANFTRKDQRTKSPAYHILQGLWDEVVSNVVETLESRTLEELCDQHRKMESQIMYYI
jgi:Rrf2 family transcriptional regulator, cysteine metabolism repressor